MQRINARLSDDLARKLRRVCEATHKSATDILRESLERYRENVLGQHPNEILKSSGFIGCIEDDADLSVTYKSKMTQSLGRKA